MRGKIKRPASRSRAVGMLAAAALPLLPPHAQHLLGPDVVRHQVAKPAALEVEPAVGKRGRESGSQQQAAWAGCSGTQGRHSGSLKVEPAADSHKRGTRPRAPDACPAAPQLVCPWETTPLWSLTPPPAGASPPVGDAVYPKAAALRRPLQPAGQRHVLELEQPATVAGRKCGACGGEVCHGC